MASIKNIKELREKVGVGFLDCRKALDASNDNVEKAIKWLEENGKAKVARKASRIATEGIVKAVKNENGALIMELNCETDFVAKNDKFIALATKIANALLETKGQPKDWKNLKINGTSITNLIEKAIVTIGEKISFRRFKKIEFTNVQSAGVYTHFDNQKASFVVVEGAKSSASKDLAMHVAAMNPQYMAIVDVPIEKIEKLKNKFKTNPVLKGKPEKIQANIMSGMLRKSLSENTFEEQEFVVVGGKTVKKYLKEQNLKLIRIERFEVGEGIEKVSSNFATEVMDQMKGSF